MADELVGCICSSLAGLMGAVRDAVASANALGSPSDVLPSGGDTTAVASGSVEGGRGEQATAGGLSPTQIASLILIMAPLQPRQRHLGVTLPEKMMTQAPQSRELMHWQQQKQQQQERAVVVS
ncbi:hypothetical protein cyc_07422 [Cyclospora cayetanensis]|uniref:Uncharacterized protein n=1 Tax=Cyclospora cayetanensis TaxID=88456 RepID=A0A1D3CTP9_9EIME|nr:hypothetical protein cyc_07422 [Cyclospora cayetanensis]